MRGNLYENTLITFATTAAAGSTVITTNRVDMQGFEGVMFICHLSSKAANSSNYHFRAQGSTADSTSGAVWYADTVSKSTARAASSATFKNYKIAVGDVYKPTHRYIRGQFYSTAAGNASTGDSVSGAYAIRYSPRYAGTTTLIGVYSTHVGVGGVVIGGTS